MVKQKKKVEKLEKSTWQTENNMINYRSCQKHNGLKTKVSETRVSETKKV